MVDGAIGSCFQTPEYTTVNFGYSRLNVDKRKRRRLLFQAPDATVVLLPEGRLAVRFMKNDMHAYVRLHVLTYLLDYTIKSSRLCASTAVSLRCLPVE